MPVTKECKVENTEQLHTKIDNRNDAKLELM